MSHDLCYLTGQDVMENNISFFPREGRFSPIIIYNSYMQRVTQVNYNFMILAWNALSSLQQCQMLSVFLNWNLRLGKSA